MLRLYGTLPRPIRTCVRVLAVLCIGLYVPLGAASAAGVLQGDQCVIEADQTVEGDLFVLCRYFTLEGRVTGSVYGAALSANLFGTVEGAVYMAAVKLDIAATLGGSLHFGGLSVDIDAPTRFTAPTADLVAVSLNTALAGDGLPGSIVNIGYQLLIDAPVERDVRFWGSTLVVDAAVSGSIDATVGSPQSSGAGQLAALVSPLSIDLTTPGLRVGDGGTVGGTLRYEGPVEGTFSGERPTATVFVPLIDPSTQLPTSPNSFAESLGRYLVQVAREWAVLAIIASISLFAAPRAVQFPLTGLYERPIASVGVGLIAFIISFPVFLILIVLSVLIVLVFAAVQFTDMAILAGVLFAALNFAAATLFYFVAIFIARVIICMAIGRWALRRLRVVMPAGRARFAGVLLGALILAALASAPFIGPFVNALAAFFGLGALIVRLQSRADAAGFPPMAPAMTTPRLRLGGRPPLPPPLDNDDPPAPGSANLPNGFNWWN